MDRIDDRHLTAEAGPPEQGEGRVLSAHLGRSANCSSVGSVVDLLFVSSVVGSAILVSLAVLLRRATDDVDEDPRDAARDTAQAGQDDEAGGAES